MGSCVVEGNTPTTSQKDKETLRETCQESRYHCQDSNCESPEYKSGTLLLKRSFSIWMVQSTELHLIRAGWWGVGVSGAVRKPLSSNETIGLVPVEGTGSSTTTCTQLHLPAFWSAAACSQKVHCTKIFWMGSSNSSFTMETCACAFNSFLAGIY